MFASCSFDGHSILQPLRFSCRGMMGIVRAQMGLCACMRGVFGAVTGGTGQVMPWQTGLSQRFAANARGICEEIISDVLKINEAACDASFR
jgi:hypothetical protein